MYYDNLSAMNAFSDGVAITAHNVANINTSPYENRNFAYGAGPTGLVEAQESRGIGQKQSKPPAAPKVETNRDSAADYNSWNTGPIHNNVSLERQMVNLITAQMGFEINAIFISQQATTEQDALRGLMANYNA